MRERDVGPLVVIETKIKTRVYLQTVNTLKLKVSKIPEPAKAHSFSHAFHLKQLRPVVRLYWVDLP